MLLPLLALITDVVLDKEKVFLMFLPPAEEVVYVWMTLSADNTNEK